MSAATARHQLLPVVLCLGAAWGCNDSQHPTVLDTDKPSVGSSTGGSASRAGDAGATGISGTGGTNAANGGGGGTTMTGGAAGAGGGTFKTDNLLIDGDAENGTAAWGAVVAGAAIQAEKYGADGYPAATDPGPATRGVSFFYGGQAAQVDAHQVVDVSTFAERVDAGAHFNLSAYLGGYLAQDDRAAVVVQLLGADGASLGTETLGGPYAAERIDTTGLLANSLDAKLPATTRSIDVHLVFMRAGGAGNDGYADNVVLTLHD